MSMNRRPARALSVALVDPAGGNDVPRTRTIEGLRERSLAVSHLNRPAGTDRQNGGNCPIHQCTTSSRFSELTPNSVSRVLEAVKRPNLCADSFLTLRKEVARSLPMFG